MKLHLSVRVFLAAAVAAGLNACSGGNAVVPERSAAIQTESSETAASAPQNFSVPAYRLVILPAGLMPAKVNDKGVIVGSDQSTNRAFEYKDGHVTELPLLPTDQIADALDINDSGQIVGYSVNQNATGNPSLPSCGGLPCPDIHAVLWEHGGVRDLGRAPEQNGIPSFDNVAEKINNRGEIVGESGFPFGALREVALAFFSPGPVRPALVGGSEVYGQIFDLNDRGEFVGSVEVDPGLFELESFAGPNPLNCAPPITSVVGGDIRGINDSGETVSANAAGQFVLCRHGVGQILKDFFAYPSTINNSGDVVGMANAPETIVYSRGKFFKTGVPSGGIAGQRFGSYFLSRDGTVRGHVVSVSTDDALLYEHGKFYDLNDIVPNHPGFQIQGPLSINNSGEIVGTSFVCCANPRFVSYVLIPRSFAPR